MKNLKNLLFLGVISLAMLSFSGILQDEWVVPDKYQNMKNPTDPEEDLSIGKSLYSKHCQSCHGKEGYGDGKKANGTIEVITRHDDAVITLSVSDNGVGIPEDLKDKMFKSRFTTKDYGHGFGMVTCGRILEYHSARHSVESRLDQGTSIRIDFPIE